MEAAFRNKNQIQNPMTGHSGVLGFMITVIMLYIAHITLQGWAAIATIFSGTTVGGLALFRFIKEFKRWRKG